MTIAGRESNFARRFASGFLTLIATVLIAGFLAAALVYYSPGFGFKECEWNPSVSAETCRAMEARINVSLPVFYSRYVAGTIHGTFGISESLQRPVAGLLKDRAAVSSPVLLWGTLGGLALGGLFAWLAVWPRLTSLQAVSTAASGLLLAVPPAVLALFLFFREWPLWIGVALALMPRVFGTTRALLQDTYASPTLLAARARGLSPLRLAGSYVMAPSAPQFAALAGVAFVLAFGFLIPIEALCDVPGIGQLTWLAAGKRDLPLLSAMALLIAMLVAFVHWLGELAR